MSFRDEVTPILDDIRENVFALINRVIDLAMVVERQRAAPYSVGQTVIPTAHDGAPIYEAWRPNGKDVKRATWPMVITAVDGGWLQVAAPDAKFPLGLWVRESDVRPR